MGSTKTRHTAVNRNGEEWIFSLGCADEGNIAFEFNRTRVARCTFQRQTQTDRSRVIDRRVIDS